ncbi:DUF4239 domain-containing protein [Actinoallomurus sp. NBC_01490]|uniref:bestrophin-like domain n=1 Tax=Actinoallomurus sp. NBC_01490 TaxID=2903557 RepID=UPI002E30807C|nr:hypothetical protein [Actinoallomurus sp. NBC_01490]
MLVCILAVVAAVGVVVAAALLFRKFGRGSDDGDPGGATAGHAGSMLSALFLLVFAIAIVVPWTTADSARENTYTEGRALVEAYWAAAALPAPQGHDVQADLRAYTDLIVGREWRSMKRGHVTAEGDDRLTALRAKVNALPVADDDQKDDRDAVVEQLQALATARGQRAMDAKARPPVGLLYMTVLTGLVVLVFPFMAGARPRAMTIVPLGVMAALLGVGVFLAFDISHVFTGALRVKPDAYITAQHEFQQIPESR